MSNVRLEVTEDILDRVVYGMENQRKELFLDPSDGQLREKSPERRVLIPMPEWTPADGFRLMDSFTATISDSAFRESLQSILQSGNGVFRRFKDTLKGRPGTEGLWHRYKQREMRKAALSWLSRWSDALELESLETEPEEDLDDLSLSEFSFRKATEQDIQYLKSSVRAAQKECQPEASLTYNQAAQIPDAWIVEAPGDTAVGCIISRADTDRDNSLILETVYVEPGFRGLGIGRKLTELMLENIASGQGIRMQSGPVGDSTQIWLKSLGFAPVSIIWQRASRR